MGNLHDLLVLLALLAALVLWLRLSAARERAAGEARQQCERYGLQMLDESVGLRALRLRRVAGRLRLERCYGFEVSIDGADREQASLWMLGNTLRELRLPTVILTPPQNELPDLAAETQQTPTRGMDRQTDEPVSGSNVIPLSRRRRSSGNDTLD